MFTFEELGRRIVKGVGTRRVRTDADCYDDDLVRVTFEERPSFFQARRGPRDGDLVTYLAIEISASR